MIDGRRAVFAAVFVAGLLGTQRAGAEDPALLESGAVTPTPAVGGEIDGVLAATDVERAVARIVVTSDKTTAHVSVAPLLTLGDYVPVLSETRVGVGADSTGGSNLGLSIGYNEPRTRLDGYAKDPKFCESTGPVPAPDPDLLNDVKGKNQAICATAQAVCGPGGGEACRATAEICREEIPGVPPNILLTRLLQKASAIGEPAPFSAAAPVPPSPPAAPAGAPDAAYAAALSRYLTQLTEYQQKLAAHEAEVWAHQQRRIDFSTLQRHLVSGSLLNEKVTVQGNSALNQRETDRLGERQTCRMERAYSMASTVVLSGSVGFFPLFFGPDIAPEEGDPLRDGSPNVVKRLDLSLGYRFHFQRTIAAQLHGGYRAERADSVGDSELLPRAVLGAGLGVFVPFAGAKSAASGFQPGVGLGLSGTVWFCGADGGCLTPVGSPDPAYGDNKGQLPLSRRAEVTGFVEWRIEEALQFRGGVSWRTDTVKGHIERTDPALRDATLTRLSPIVAVGSSFWGI